LSSERIQGFHRQQFVLLLNKGAGAGTDWQAYLRVERIELREQLEIATLVPVSSTQESVNVDDRIDDYRQVERRWALPRGGSSVPTCIPQTSNTKSLKPFKTSALPTNPWVQWMYPTALIQREIRSQILQFLLQGRHD
jgi:hypothetical protein